MRRILFLLLGLISVGPVSDCRAQKPIRVMSFNLRYGSANDGENRWQKRDQLVAETVQRFSPDLLGTQETLRFQADFLRGKLKDYVYFGRSRMKTPNEHCGVFFRKARFTMLAGGHFWLSKSPEVPASKSWDSSLPRMATWVLLSEKAQSTAAPILFVNTHFDHRGRVARLESARLIRKRLASLKAVFPRALVIVTGDFNAAEGTAPYEALLKGNRELVDTFRVAHPTRGEEEGTFGGFQGRRDGGRIDWILADPGLAVKSAAIDRYSPEGRYPSDHYPVTAVLAPATRSPAP